MNKFMKKIFCLIMIIFCFEIVNAKELVKKYEDYLGEGSSSVILDEDGIYNFDVTPKGNSTYVFKYDLYDTNGKVLKTKEKEFLYYFSSVTLIDDKILIYYRKWNGDDYLYFVEIYNTELELIKTVETCEKDFIRNEYKGYNEDYYMWDNLVFDRKSNELVDVKKLLEDDKYGDKLFAGTYYPMYLRSKLLDSTLVSYENDYLFGDFTFSNCYIAVPYFKVDEFKYYVAILNKDFDIVLDLKLDSDKTFSNVVFTDNSFYVSEYIIDEESPKNEINDFYGYVRLKEYDYSGNVIDTYDLFEVYYDFLADDYRMFNVFGRYVTNIQILNDEIFVLSSFGPGTEWAVTHPVDGLFVTGEDSTVHHYTFKYDITTKTDGNGSVEVVDKANYKDNIPFKVIPNDGYVVKDINVTTKNGETISFEDYKFIMPSDDVIIEVTFEKEVSNPVTSSFNILLLLVIAIVMFKIYINLHKRKSWFGK